MGLTFFFFNAMDETVHPFKRQPGEQGSRHKHFEDKIHFKYKEVGGKGRLYKESMGQKLILVSYVPLLRIKRILPKIILRLQVSDCAVIDFSLVTKSGISNRVSNVSQWKKDGFSSFKKPNWQIEEEKNLLSVKPEDFDVQLEGILAHA